MKAKKRWVVREETRSWVSIAMITGSKPLVTYRYYRWRWFALLATLPDPWPIPFITTQRTLLGRITMKQGKSA